MKTFEINGNLTSIENSEVFYDTIKKVWDIFVSTFGSDVMKKYDLYLDNALEMTGHAPMIIPVLQKYLFIKLHIKNFSDYEKIAYQFSHELCHYVFYSIIGINKKMADCTEENLCSAMSLVILHMLYPDTYQEWEEYVENLDDFNYNRGAYVAKKINYDINALKDIIYMKCKEESQKSIV